ncbi:hypothetical protein ANDROMEDA_45 [Bacillus phage Andromeda]|uniref:Uncharacterized protein n=2 Tax=Andromedavirus andromeda TaxID=1273739 RepID=M1IR13_9CAUD|nr:hypothetical protein I905_gp45 [Bacillus phage Andromeda]AGE60884.1 hypothetical protein GEMINI_45 [Bacillus phage Gemini]AGE61115.1 hypothetical protein ANDROMEDA_45 [Bacillus phage Andromeda]
MSESRFPHLRQYGCPHGELYQSEQISDYDASFTSVLEYQVDTQDNDIAVNVTEYSGNHACFVLRKDHIPFLEQLLNDLKEVSKDE